MCLSRSIHGTGIFSYIYHKNHVAFDRYTDTLPKTNSSPMKIGHPKRKRSYSTHPCSGANCWLQGEYIHIVNMIHDGYKILFQRICLVGRGSCRSIYANIPDKLTCIHIYIYMHVNMNIYIYIFKHITFTFILQR